MIRSNELCIASALRVPASPEVAFSLTNTALFVRSLHKSVSDVRCCLSPRQMFVKLRSGEALQLDYTCLEDQRKVGIVMLGTSLCAWSATLQASYQCMREETIIDLNIRIRFHGKGKMPATPLLKILMAWKAHRLIRNARSVLKQQAGVCDRQLTDRFRSLKHRQWFPAYLQSDF